MKKSISFILLQFAVLSALATLVGPEKAQSVAERYIESRAGKDFVVKSSQKADGAFYIVNFAPQGWVIVAADDVVKPIIGYSLSGSLDMNKMPDNASYILDGYKKQI